MHPLYKNVAAAATALLVIFSISAAENLPITIIDRQNHDATYTYYVPGSSTSKVNLNCSGSNSDINCYGTSETINRPGRKVSYDVSGATLSLKLPDGSIAVVNCDKALTAAS